MTEDNIKYRVLETKRIELLGDKMFLCTFGRDGKGADEFSGFSHVFSRNQFQKVFGKRHELLEHQSHTETIYIYRVLLWFFLKDGETLNVIEWEYALDPFAVPLDYNSTDRVNRERARLRRATDDFVDKVEEWGRGGPMDSCLDESSPFRPVNVISYGPDAMAVHMPEDDGLQIRRIGRRAW